MKQNKLTKEVMDSVISRVRFERASFTLPGHRLGNKEDTDLIRETTRIYFDTYVIPFLEAVRDGDMNFIKQCKGLL